MIFFSLYGSAVTISLPKLSPSGSNPNTLSTLSTLPSNSEIFPHSDPPRHNTAHSTTNSNPTDPITPARVKCLNLNSTLPFSKP